MSLTKQDLKELGNWFALWSVLVVLTYLIPNLLGLAFRGFDEPRIFNLQTFYNVSLAGAVALFGLKLYSVFIKKGDAKYGNSILFNDKGEFPSIRFFKNFSNIQLAWLSGIIFFTISLISIVYLKTGSFTGLSQLPTQQFTEIQSIAYSSFLVAGAENFVIHTSIALLLVGLGVYARKKNLEKSTFRTLSLFGIPLTIGFLWVMYHLSAYSGSDLSLLVVFGFGIVGAFLTVATGSFIPFYLLHIANNTTIDISRFFSSDAILISYGFILLILTVGYFAYYKGKSLSGVKSGG